MSNKKQTAVEWLVEQLQYKFSIPFDFNTEDLDDFNITIQQSKEMEKQQIIEAHLDGQSLVSCKDEYAEQYYNENYEI
jgi:hypothetical protein